MTIAIDVKRKAVGFTYVGGPADDVSDLFLEGKEDGVWLRKKLIGSLTAGLFEASYPAGYSGPTELRVVDGAGNVIDQTPPGGLQID